MRTIGNTLSNQRYNPSNKSPPTTAFSGGDTYEDIELERFIRDKYDRKTLSKARKLPPLPSPTASFHAGDSDKISGQRSPSLGSNSSTNLKIGQRVSGESFESARSPASTNSSLELPLSKPSRPSNSAGNPFIGDPLRWTGLEKNIPSLPNPSPTLAAPASKEVLFSQSSLGMQSETVSSMNPFQDSSGFSPQPQPQPPSLQPVPQITSFPPQAQQNPFDGLNEQTVFNLPRTTSMPPQQGAQPMWNTGSSYQPTSNGGQINSTFSPSSGTSSHTAQNPFFTQQTTSSPPSTSPTNLFFPSQTTNAPFTPVYQPQSQPSYQSHQLQPSQAQQTPFQQSQPQQIQFQPQPHYQQTFQPLQTYTSNQKNSNPVYPTQRMDKQSILNLFNSPPPPSPNSNPVPQFVQNENVVPAWNQQGM
jgi:hypothetical protein